MYAKRNAKVEKANEHSLMIRLLAGLHTCFINLLTWKTNCDSAVFIFLQGCTKFSESNVLNFRTSNIAEAINNLVFGVVLR